MSGERGAGRWAKGIGLAVLGLVCFGTTGCGDFFVCAKSSCTSSGSGSGTTTNTGNFAYVSNSPTGTTYLNEYSLSSTGLTAISGSPFSLGYVPVAMKVSPKNGFLYVAAGSTGNIYLYTIGSTGALTTSASNPIAVSTSGSASSLDISPDGNFLYVMDQTGVFLNQYTLNTTSGAVAGSTPFTVPGSSGCAPGGTPVSQLCTVQVSPKGNYVAVALGAAGTVVFPYTSSGGISAVNYTGTLPCCANVASPSGDFSLAFDGNSNLYIARTLALSSYSNVGTSSPAYQGSVTYGGGQTPRSVTFSSGYTYLYTANEGAGTISGFSLSGTAQLTGLSASPYTGPTNVSALGLDSTGTYLLAVGYNATTGLQMFKPSSGALGAALATAGTGTNTASPALLALTH